MIAPYDFGASTAARRKQLGEECNKADDGGTQKPEWKHHTKNADPAFELTQGLLIEPIDLIN